VVAVAEADPSRRQQLEVEGLRTFETLSEAIAHLPAIGLVDVCTPPQFHKDIVIEALQHDRHVLSEKPFVMDLAEAREIEDVAAVSKGRVSVMHNWLGLRAVRELRQRIQQDRLGRVFAAHCLWLQDHNRDTQGIRDPNHWVHSLAGGRIEETAPHILYTLIALLQDTEMTVRSAVFSKRTSYPWVVADTVAGTLASERSTATFFLSYAMDRHDHCAFTAVGPQSAWRADVGTGVVEPFGLHYNDRGKRASLERVEKLGESIARRTAIGVGTGVRALRHPAENGDVWLMSEVVRSIETGSPPPVTLADAIATVRMTRDLSDRLSAS
jgi:predicted dehydrogenase